MAQTKPEKQYGLFCLGGGRGATLKESDLWGITNALIHALDTGYMKDNQEWAMSLIKRINELRGIE